MRTQQERIFDDDTLWEELNGSDRDRRVTALRALEALGELAILRSAARSIAYSEIWNTIYDHAQLCADLHDESDKRVHRAAWHVWDEITHLVALRDVATKPTPREDKEWARELRAKIHARLQAMRLALATQSEGSHA